MESFLKKPATDMEQNFEKDYGYNFWGGIFAWVSVNNSASMRCVEKAGYKQTDISEERNLALFEEPQLFYKWIMVSK